MADGKSPSSRTPTHRHDRMTCIALLSDDDFFWEVNEALEGRYTAKRQEAEENKCIWWFVEHARVVVREGPSVTAKMVDALRQGALVHVAEVELVDAGNGKAGSRWLRLHKDELKHFRKSASGALAGAVCKAPSRSHLLCSRVCMHRRSVDAGRRPLGWPEQSLARGAARDRLEALLAGRPADARRTCGQADGARGVRHHRTHCR